MPDRHPNGTCTSLAASCHNHPTLHLRSIRTHQKNFWQPQHQCLFSSTPDTTPTVCPTKVPITHITQDTRSAIVYRVPCKDRNSFYVGLSKRSLAAWLKEHQRAVFTGDSTLWILAEHSIKIDHEDRIGYIVSLYWSCQAFRWIV